MRQVKIVDNGSLISKTIEIEIPERFAEMSAEQFRAVCAIHREEIDESEFLLRFFGIKANLLERLDKFYIFKLTELLQCLADNDGVDKFFIQSVKIGSTVYKSPMPKLAGMTLMQFMTVDTFHSWYEYTKKDGFLYKFVASLMLETGMEFGQLDVDEFFQTFEMASRDNDKLYLDLVVNWSLIKSWLCKVYPHLFPTAVDDGKKKKKERPSSWVEIYDALVGDNLMNLEAYKTLPAMDVLRVMNTRIRDGKKQKR